MLKMGLDVRIDQLGAEYEHFKKLGFFSQLVQMTYTNLSLGLARGEIGNDFLDSRELPCKAHRRNVKPLSVLRINFESPPNFHAKLSKTLKNR